VRSMRWMTIVVLFLATLLMQLAQAQSAPGVYAIKGAKVYTVSGAPIENGTVIIRAGKIAAVGTNVEIPADAQVIDAA
jgi:imidazolonepropionase-like amidohydrolase